MLIAVTTGESGKKRLILGLEAENIKRLLGDEPILKNLEEQKVEGLENWEVAILGPEDTVRFVAHFGVKVEK